MLGVWVLDYDRYAAHEVGRQQVDPWPRSTNEALSGGPVPDEPILGVVDAVPDPAFSVEGHPADSLVELVTAEGAEGRPVQIRGLEIDRRAMPPAEAHAFWARSVNASGSDATKVLLVLPPEATAAQPVDPRYALLPGMEVEVTGALASVDRLAPSLAVENGGLGVSVRTVDVL
jgi:hypothetical protein